MNIGSMIDERLIAFDFSVEDKADAIKKIAHMVFESEKVSDEKEYVEGLLEREAEFETGIGNGIAIPHCKRKCVKQAAFTLVHLNHPIEWGAMDGAPVNYVIMLAAPDGEDNVHIDILAALARRLMDSEFRSSLLNAKSIDDIKKIFN
ncbi:MAG: PTS sugar transporter subunit IIA [Lachnospiraceae bacterium]|nr:PTS sugar transporter subunit IIA [Lachnospiraceae bacterium]